MNARYRFNRTLVLCLVSLSCLSLAGCGAQPAPSSGVPGPIQAQFIHASSIEELTEQATVIVIGRVNATDETLNMARNINDPTKEDPNVLGLGRVHQVKVERYLKGGGTDTLEVLLPEALLSARIPKTKDNIELARKNYPQVPFRANARYLLFLQPAEEFPGKQYFVGVPEPWRFDLANPAAIQAVSPWEEAPHVFPDRSLTDTLRSVEQVVQKETVSNQKP